MEPKRLYGIVRWFVGLAVVAASCTSCDDQDQGTQYKGTGFKTFWLGSQGFVDVVSGCKVDSQGNDAGAVAPLLFLVWIIPDLRGKVSNAGDGSKGNTSNTIYWHRWELLGGDRHRLEFTWDRKAHTISIGNTTYRLESGNTFLIEVNDSWQVTATPGEGQISIGQTPNADPRKENAELLSLLKAKFSKNAQLQRMCIDPQ